MKVNQLRVRGLRCLDDVSVDLADGMNVFVGANGAGKTSLLEAVFLLSHGRSFRSGARDALLQRGASALSVFATLQRAPDVERRLGLARDGSRWIARVDGETKSLTELVSECAVTSFEPGSHALIAGSAEERRRFMDWGVFHVEQAFLGAWRRYNRALKQRNSLLRAGSTDPGLYLPWEIELDEQSALIGEWRRGYLYKLSSSLAAHAAELLPELGPVTLNYRQGWTENLGLAEVLAMQRNRDMSRGHTTQGVHRADWALEFEHAPMREHLSRGQEKLTALACLLAQAELYAATAGEWPVVCLDDLASELDQDHQRALVTRLRGARAQILITGTERPQALDHAVQMFHVEQGAVTPLL
jgi:DNA replication and repair protein RecF